MQGVSEQVQVSGDAPILEPKRQAISTSVTNQELQNIPTARDPWVVLQTMPGVIVDRVNVGGSESGQQSNYVAKGATTGDNTWYMDGIPITDMSALGSSPSYYDFDMFQEMQVTTGGADARQATPGRADELRAQVGHQHAARHRRAPITRTRTCRATTCRPIWSRTRSAAPAARATA